MGNSEKLFSTIKELLIEQLGIPESFITEDAYLIDDLGMDSLDWVELIMSLEDEFDIEIQDEDAEKVTTVGDLADYIAELTE